MSNVVPYLQKRVIPKFERNWNYNIFLFNVKATILTYCFVNQINSDVICINACDH